MSKDLRFTRLLRGRLSVLMSAGALSIGGAAVAGCGGEESGGSEAAGGGPPAPQTNEEGPAEQRPSEVTLAEILANPRSSGRSGSVAPGRPRVLTAGVTSAGPSVAP